MISVPHDGALIPGSIKKSIKPDFWDTPDRDTGIGEVFAFDAFPYSKIVATHSRYVVDLNRSATGGALYPGQQETSVCPVRTFRDQSLYREGMAPSQTAIQERIVTYWQPYHDQLQGLIDAAISRHGWCLLVDAHSIDAELPMLFEGRLPDINVGTNEGLSCSADIQRMFTETLRSQNQLTHVVNGRFKGGHITRHYGKPDKNCHAVQLEHVKDCYQGQGLDKVRALWQQVLSSVLDTSN